MSDPEVPVTVTVAVPAAALAEAVRVRVEGALPPAGGVTGLAENDAVTPAGRPDALKVVAALKPFRLVTVTVVLPLPLWVTVREVGDTAMPKSGAACAWTTRVAPPVWLSDPLVPETVKAEEPTGVLAAVVIVRVEELPVAGLGLKLPLAAAGRPLMARSTAPAKPPVRVTLTV